MPCASTGVSWLTWANRRLSQLSLKGCRGIITKNVLDRAQAQTTGLSNLCKKSKPPVPRLLARQRPEAQHLEDHGIDSAHKAEEDLHESD